MYDATQDKSEVCAARCERGRRGAHVTVSSVFPNPSFISVNIGNKWAFLQSTSTVSAFSILSNLRSRVSARDSVVEALLSLLKVDDVPDGVEVLQRWINQRKRITEKMRTSGRTLRYWR
jgi:hypothetical protein